MWQVIKTRSKEVIAAFETRDEARDFCYNKYGLNIRFAYWIR